MTKLEKLSYYRNSIGRNHIYAVLKYQTYRSQNGDIMKKNQKTTLQKFKMAWKQRGLNAEFFTRLENDRSLPKLLIQSVARPSTNTLAP